VTAGFVVVANAAAGSTESDAVASAVATLAGHAPTELRWTDDPDECLEVVRGLDDDRQLVVAGGDGSIHLALSAVTHHDRTDGPVGIVPLGTGNDFARNHGIPLDPVLAAGVIIAGHAVPVDAMRLDGEAVEPDDRPQLVANNIHAGLGVLAARRAKGWKPYTRRFSYPLATAYEGVAGETTALTITADGHVVHDGPVLAALVLLGPSMGGGVEVMPDEPDRLDLVVVEPAEGRDRFQLVGAALRHRLHEARRAEHREVSTVTLAPKGGDTVDVNVDGEMVSYRGPITLEHLPGAWRVLLPQPS
jgi:diacylglycerol kinase family enzyme